jgi:hypothetical protein
MAPACDKRASTTTDAAALSLVLLPVVELPVAAGPLAVEVDAVLTVVKPEGEAPVGDAVAGVAEPVPEAGEGDTEGDAVEPAEGTALEAWFALAGGGTAVEGSTSAPTPQGIASLLPGCVGLAGGVVSPFAEAMVKRVVQVLSGEPGAVNW